MRELEKDEAYSGKIQFTIVPSTKEGFAEEVNQFNIGDHGLVAFNAKGEVATQIAGHSFGKAEIESAIKTLLEARPKSQRHG